MRINEIIKEKRNAQGLTQEQVAMYLGVSTPAVNKWEKGTCYPDITLLPALARLLKVDLNTLLSFKEDLSEQEIGVFVNELVKIANNDGFHIAFEKAMDKIYEYPTCDKLILTVSTVMQGSMYVFGADDKEKGISITIVNVTGIVLMFLLPIISQFLYNNEITQTSAMVGGILQSVGQVVASGAMVNEHVKDLSTIFKIVRIIFLVVVVFVLGHLKHKSNKEIIEEEVQDIEKGKIKIPWYVIGFFITCALFSLNIINTDVSVLCKEISNKFEIIALAAIGLRVNVKDLIKQGKSVSLYGLFIALLQIVSAITLIGILL